MPIDTQDKRASAINNVLVWNMPQANSAISSLDREQATFLPAIITPGAPVGVAIEGQPVMVRHQLVPFLPGYSDRPRKWNVLG